MSVRLLVFGILAVVTASLGLIGFAAYLPSRPEFGRGFLDRLFYSIQLFFVAAEPVKNGGPMPAVLNLARFLGPMVTASAVIEVFATVFAAQRQQWRARSSRRHVVVCGSGGDALLLVSRLRAKGSSVVLVDQRPSDDAVNACRRVRVPVVVGDPTDETVLRSAGTANAESVYAMSSGSVANTSIAVAARAVDAGRQIPLTCFASVPDRDLRAALLARGLGRTGNHEFRLVLFSTDEIAARVLAQNSPLTTRSTGAAPHILVAGLDDFGQTLALELARRWRVHVNLGRARLILTVAGPYAAAFGDRLRQRFPALDTVCEVRFVPAQLTSLANEHAGLLESADRVFVCADDDVVAVKIGLSILRALRDHEVQVTVRVRERGAELNEAFHGASGRLFDDVSGSLRIFGALDEACRPDAIQAGAAVEEIARSLHDEYVAQCAANGDTPSANPSMAPWEALAEDLKNANRAQARHLGEKLSAIGCIAVPVFDSTMSFAFRSAPDEVAQLARMEHQRWAEERRARGYIYGPNRGEQRHPNLVDWDELPESAREKNRMFVRALPRVLVGAGFQILRLAISPP
ncbi:NAD-binding protein [Amycolatopsis sp., V23-08]|uniref:NAD-binding protein n=1 Tax=Amycolatopsis heterodermiae TaxID=3110235 RepID=A0ABU5R9G3_9PSEU|nr:NAD-binding protein [Amycolatopsis sp., V23-08]MEA5362881.1 NAD-binding protein [Amycolatopsis sp., V23-08]